MQLTPAFSFGFIALFLPARLQNKESFLLFHEFRMDSTDLREKGGLNWQLPRKKFVCEHNTCLEGSNLDERYFPDGKILHRYLVCMTLFLHSWCCLCHWFPFQKPNHFKSRLVRAHPVPFSCAKPPAYSVHIHSQKKQPRKIPHAGKKGLQSESRSENIVHAWNTWRCLLQDVFWREWEVWQQHSRCLEQVLSNYEGRMGKVERFRLNYISLSTINCCTGNL